jgi:hypothetical protein
MKKTILCLLTTPLLLAVSVGGCSQEDNNTLAAIHGVVSDEGTPIEGVIVKLDDGQDCTTNGDGYYKFTNLEPRTYTMTVQKSGYKDDHPFVSAVAGKDTEKNSPLTKSE